MCNTHDDITKFSKEVSLQGLGKEISDHLLGGAMKQCNVAIGDAILNKEVSNVDVTGLLPGGGAPICF